VQCRLLLDVVIRQRAAVLKLLAREDEALLIWGDALLVLDLGLHVVDRVGRLHLKGDGLAGQRLDEDLHTTAKSEHEMEGGLLLDVVVGESSTVLELLASEDQTLLIGRDALFVLDFGLDVVDGVGWLDFESDRLTGEGLDEDLHTTAKSQDQVESRLLLDVVVAEGTAVFQLLASEDQTLLIGGNTLLVLDLGLDVVNSIRGLDLESNRLTGQGLDEDLHTTTEAEDEMEGGLLLDVIIGKSAAVFKLLAGKDEALLIGGNSFLVLNLSLHVVDGVAGLDLQGDGLSSESFHEDLHATAETEDEMKCGLLLNVVVAEGATILELLSGEDEALLVGGNTLLVLDLSLDIVDGVRRLDLEGDSFARKGLDENLHDEKFLSSSTTSDFRI